MTGDPVSPALGVVLSRITHRLQTARREALDAVAVEETEWEYAGRTWSWPAGEDRTYFQELSPGEETVLDAAEADYGIETVGVGTGRIAVTLPTDADGTDAEGIGGSAGIAKLARFGPSAEMGDGRPQNRRERRLWNRIGSHPFLPVVAASDDGNWVVMPQATVPPPPAERDDAIRTVREALATHADRFHFDELKVENVGAYDGRYWVVDYGRPPGTPLFVDPPGAGD